MEQPGIKSEMKDQMMSEESVVSKVSELMETLDHIKKYNALSGSLKKFSLIVIGSIAISLAIGILLAISGFQYASRSPESFLFGLLLLLIPLVGLAIGIFYVKRKVNATKTGEWKQKLSGAFLQL